MHVLVKINYKPNLFRKKLALCSKLFYEHIIFIPTSMPIEISAGECQFLEFDQQLSAIMNLI